MPRKVVPRWGDNGVAKVPDFKLSADQIDALAGLLEIGSPAAVETLKSNLEGIGARYLLWIQQDEKGPSRAEQNAALKKRIASPNRLEPILAQLDHATQARLLDALWTHPRIKYRGAIVQLDDVARDAPDLVIDCANLALAEGQKHRGPLPRKTLPIIIRWLASIYEEATRLQLTHTPYEKTEYTGRPQSQAGRFVTTFLSIVYPGLPQTAIATEMARRESRERNGQNSRSAVQTI